MKFCIYTVLGSFPWCLLLAFVGYELGKLGKDLSSLGSIFHGLDVVILIVVVVLVALYIWRHIRNDREARAELAIAEAKAKSEAQAAVLLQQPAPQQSRSDLRFRSDHRANECGRARGASRRRAHRH